ncbi:MAG: hypothetical protein HOH43_05825 [Candidatus Latescibacteria bacterium]|nr:hypothetical protein [Candidatus Latescibacterota bacterium]
MALLLLVEVVGEFQQFLEELLDAPAACVASAADCGLADMNMITIVFFIKPYTIKQVFLHVNDATLI